MVSPVTVIDETSNDDDDIMLNLNLDLTIDDCGSDGSNNDALAAAKKAAAAEIAAAAKDAAERAAAEMAAAAKDVVKKAAAEMAAAAKNAEKVVAAERASAAAKAAAEMAAAAKDAVKKAAAEMAAAAKDAVKKAAAEIAAASKAAAAESGSNAYPRALRIWPARGPHLSLTVRNGKVTLANAQVNDYYQQWYCDSFSHNVLEGLPTFILKNNGTDLTLQHSIGDDYPVRLINHRVGDTDRSVLWTREFQSGGKAMTIMNVDDTSLQLVVHNQNFQEGEKIINYAFQSATRHYWNVTPW